MTTPTPSRRCSGCSTVAWHGANIPLIDSVRVRYVVPLRPTQTSNVPTLAKEVVVVVREYVEGQTGRPPVTVELRQVVTPAASGR